VVTALASGGPRAGRQRARLLGLSDCGRVVKDKAIEEAAIEWVMGLEHAAGRWPRDTRCEGAPADIESLPRLIELKSFGTSNLGYDLWLEVPPPG
jgi:hypothetical protein